LRHDFDSAGLDLAIGPSVVAAEEGGKFSGTKHDFLDGKECFFEFVLKR
jgi:hypothetical protein